MHIDSGFNGLALAFLTIPVSTNYKTVQEYILGVLDNGLNKFYKVSKLLKIL